VYQSTLNGHVTGITDIGQIGKLVTRIALTDPITFQNTSTTRLTNCNIYTDSLGCMWVIFSTVA